MVFDSTNLSITDAGPQTLRRRRLAERGGGKDSGIGVSAPAPVGSLNEPTTSAPISATAGVPGATPFGPSSNLIGTQFNPQPSQRLQRTQDQVGTLQGQVAEFRGFQPFAPVGTGNQQGINQRLGQAGNLIGDATIRGTPRLLGQAEQELGGARLGSLQGQGQDTGEARRQLGSLLGGIGGSAPNRLQIAQNALKTFDEQQADQEKLGIQHIGREAAAAGRLGSGQVSTSLGDLQTQLNRARQQELRALAGDVAGQTLQDRLAAVQGTQGALGQLGGLDLSQAGLGLQAGTTAANLALHRAGALQGLGGQQFGQNEAQAQNALQRAGALQGLAGQEFGQQQGLRGEQRQDQAFGLGQQQANLGAQQGVLGQLAGLEGQQFGQEAAQRGELRGERGFQQGLEQQALENRLRQFGLEQGAQAQEFGQQQDVNQLLAQLGFGGDTSGILGGVANQLAGQGADQQAGASELLRLLFQNQGRN